MADTFRCEMCHGIFTKVTTEEEKRAEYEEIFGPLIEDDVVTVCDRCWNIIDPRKLPKA